MLQGALMGILGLLFYRLFRGKQKESQEETQEEMEKRMDRKIWKILAIVVLVPLVIGIVIEYASISSEKKATNPYKSEEYSAIKVEDPETQEFLYSISPQPYEVTAFQTKYPQTWGYIQKNAKYPLTYLGTYMEIWGDLQKYSGDGICFHTLSRQEQNYVNYPTIGSYIYIAGVNGKEYHSTQDCYALLKAKQVIKKDKLNLVKYDPCSKCVGDVQHTNIMNKLN